MSRDAIDLVRSGYRAWNRGDRDWVLEHMSPEIEWTTPPEDPERGTYSGYEGVQEFWGQWRAAVGKLVFEPEEFIDAGDHIVVTAQRSGTGEHSGLSVSDRVTQLFSFENGKCVRVIEFYDKADALREIGMDPESAPEPILVADLGD